MCECRCVCANGGMCNIATLYDKICSIGTFELTTVCTPHFFVFFHHFFKFVTFLLLLLLLFCVSSSPSSVSTLLLPLGVLYIGTHTLLNGVRQKLQLRKYKINNENNKNNNACTHKLQRMRIMVRVCDTSWQAGELVSYRRLHMYRQRARWPRCKDIDLHVHTYTPTYTNRFVALWPTWRAAEYTAVVGCCISTTQRCSQATLPFT